MHNLKKIALASLAALSLAALPACSSLNGNAEQKGALQQSTADTVQTINGAPITRADMERTVKVLLAQSGMTPPIAEDIMQKAQESALDQLITATLLYQAAAKVEIPDLDKRVDEQIARSRARFASPLEFETALKGGGMTVGDLTEFTRRDIVINSFIEAEFAPKVTVSDEEVSLFYEANRERYFKKGESVRASHILVGVDEKASFEVKEKAKEKAVELLKRVKAGENFEELAKSESSCPSSAKGGDLGSFVRGQMVPAFEQTAFSMKPGETSELVATQYGYHIIKLVDKQAARLETLAEVKEKVRDHLKRERVQKLVTEFVTELRGKAKIEKG